MMMKKILLMSLLLAMMPFAGTYAQRDKYKDYPVIYTDTVDYTKTHTGHREDRHRLRPHARGHQPV